MEQGSSAVAIEVQEISYEGWRAVLVRMGSFELTIPLEFGPRILACRFEGGEDLFHQIAADRGQRGGDIWRPYGGHRLWMAPEDYATTYYPDNDPVTISESPGAVTISAQPERMSGLRKRITIGAVSENELRVVHRLDNLGDVSLHCAPWALTILGPGTIALAALPTRGSHTDHLLPTGSLTLWAYTQPDDPRLEWKEKFVAVHGLSDVPGPVKIGLGYADVSTAWVGAVTKGCVFSKHVELKPGAYPDRDSTIEIFTNPALLEIETLGPLATLSPGRSTEHEERWCCSRFDPTRGLEGAFAVCEANRNV